METSKEKVLSRRPALKKTISDYKSSLYLLTKHKD
jgi:hypothetical protein